MWNDTATAATAYRDHTLVTFALSDGGTEVRVFDATGRYAFSASTEKAAMYAIDNAE